jgi:cytochrome P450
VPSVDTGAVALGVSEDPETCLGEAPTRLEARILFEKLLDRFSQLELAAPVRRNPSHLIAGVLEATFVFG